MSVVVPEAIGFYAVVKRKRWIVDRIFGVQFARREQLCLIQIRVVVPGKREPLSQKEINKQGFDEENRRDQQDSRYAHEFGSFLFGG